MAAQESSSGPPVPLFLRGARPVRPVVRKQNTKIEQPPARRSSLQRLHHEVDATSRALRSALIQIQREMDTLGVPDPQAKQEEYLGLGDARGSPVVRDSPRPPPAPARPVTEEERTRARRSALVRWTQLPVVIASPPRPPLNISQPQDSSDDTDDDSEVTMSEFLGGSSDGGSRPSSALAHRSSSPVPEQRDEQLAWVEGWQLEATKALQELLGTLHMDKCTEVLEELDGYFSTKQQLLVDEDRQLGDIEAQQEAKSAVLEHDTSVVKAHVDEREASMYRVLRRYDLKLRGLGAMGLEAPKRLKEVKTELQGGRPEVPLQPGEVLSVVATIQDELDALKSVVELEEGRVKAYTHAERELSAATVTAYDGVLSDPVVAEVVEEVRASNVSRLASNTNKYLSDKEDPPDENVFDLINRLKNECDDLRLRVELGNKARRRPRADVLTDRQARREEAPPWDGHELFDRMAEERYQTEMERIWWTCEEVEKMVHSLQSLQVQALGTSPVLEDGVKKLADATQLAKRHNAIGQLPLEEDSNETLVRDLREANQEISDKQEADHAATMQKLEALAAKLTAELQTVNEKVKMLEWAVSREDERHKAINKELTTKETQGAKAKAKLENLPPLNLHGEQAELEIHEQILEDLQQQVDQARERLRTASHKVTESLAVFKQAQAAGGEIESTERWRQLREGHDEVREPTVSPVLSRIDQLLPCDDWELDVGDLDKIARILHEEEVKATEARIQAQAKKFEEASNSRRPSKAAPPATPLLQHRQRRAAVPSNVYVARQQWRTRELLREAAQDEQRAQELREKTAEMREVRQALQDKAVQLLGLDTELAELFGFDELDQLDMTAPPEVQALYEEARARKRDFDFLSAKWRQVRTVARQGGRTVLKGGGASEELRLEVMGLCEFALEKSVPPKPRPEKLDSSSSDSSVY